MQSPLKRVLSPIIRQSKPEAPLTNADRRDLSAHAMDNIREFLRQFRGNDSYLDLAIGHLQRLPDFHCDLMDFVDPEMRLRDYLDAVSRVSREWLAELDMKHPARSTFPASMRTAVFAGYDTGWEAYSAHMRKQIPWFS